MFVICASDGAWTLRDLYAMSELGDEVHERLPGHRGEPHAAVCLVFDDAPPRGWYGGELLHGRGGWVLGVDWLLPWITGIAADERLRPGDVRRLDDAAGPRWERRSSARLPARPNFG